MTEPVIAPATAPTEKTTEDNLEPQFDEGATDAFEPEVVEAEKEEATPAETPEDDRFAESKKFEDPDFVDTVKGVDKEASAEEAAKKTKVDDLQPKPDQSKSLKIKIKIGEEEKEVGVEELEKGYNLALQLQDKAEDVLQL